MTTLLAAALIVCIGSAAVVLTSRLERAERDRLDALPGAAPSVPAPTAAARTAPAGGTARRAPENAVERLVVALKRRRVLRLGLSVVSVALLLGAAGMIGYPFYTNLYQDRVQSRLDRQLASPEIKDAYVNRQVEVGDSLTRIQIPRLGVDTVVVEGTTASALRAGAGHYPSTPLPCEVGNVGIAGHRTTYGRPFHDLDQLEVGDRIILETPIGRCTYEVQDLVDCDGNGRTREGAHCLVSPTDVGVVANTPEEARVTLTTCHPKGSARLRLIVTATMVSAEAFGA